MAITHVQGTAGNSLTGTIQLTGVVVGDLLTFQLGTSGVLGIYAPTGITDSSGDAWPAVLVKISEGGGNTDAETWGIIAIHAGTHTLTVTMGGTANGAPEWFFDEWSGVLSATPDVTNSGTGATSASPAPSATPSKDGELVISVNSPNGGTANSVSGGWTILPNPPGTLTSPASAVYQIQTTATAAAATFTNSGAPNQSQVIATFKAAGTSAPAGLASDTAAGLPATANVEPNAGSPSVADTAPTATANVGPNAASPTMSASAANATVIVGPSPAPATAAWSGFNATVPPAVGTLRRPLYPASTGSPTQISPPDTIDPAILPLASNSPLPAAYAAS